MADASQWKVEFEAEGEVWKAKQDAHAEQTARHVDEIAELFTLAGESPAGNPSTFDTARDCVTSGSGTAYTATFLAAFTSLINGIELKPRWHTDSGADPTLNLDGLGAKAIKLPDGSAPPANSLKENYTGKVIYNATLDNWVLVSNVPPTIPEMGLRKMTVLTSNGTHNFQSWMRRHLVIVRGGGGGGGGGSNPGGGAWFGGSGGGAGYSEMLIDKGYATVPSATITVGSGGNGGSLQSNGTSGGSSSYANGSDTLTANGGIRGTPGSESGFNGSGGSGGSASGGTTNHNGADGNGGYHQGAVFGGSCFGSPGSPPGEDATFPGAGGGGGPNGVTGGDGGDGQVIILEFG